ncbi:tol-pal system-associated acyl-CoA thioesterase [Vibrio tetraodonis]|uniref:tol-pal system-associated acyl-CoA thioesterase n=1 Tax=Vibrio tetraodonis TaxID=2231647 RepID=UPI000E0AFBB3|nr:tol-pal system-associated acyl-CoA thioesterase [Vibrio tetraodonis]
MDINQPVFELPVTVYYEDTDIGGLAYHANYLKYFERCRSEWLTHIGVSQTSLREQNTIFVVRHVEIDFLQGARLEDRLIVKATVAKAQKASVTFCQEIVNHDGDILCKAMVKVACIDSEKMKPLAFPQNIIMELTQSDR